MARHSTMLLSLPTLCALDCRWHSSVAEKQQLEGEHLSRASCGLGGRQVVGVVSAGGCEEGRGSLQGPWLLGWGLAWGWH